MIDAQYIKQTAENLLNSDSLFIDRGKRIPRTRHRSAFGQRRFRVRGRLRAAKQSARRGFGKRQRGLLAYGLLGRHRPAAQNAAPISQTHRPARGSHARMRRQDFGHTHFRDRGGHHGIIHRESGRRRQETETGGDSGKNLPEKRNKNRSGISGFQIK